MTIDVVTYTIYKKMEVQTAFLNREVPSPKTAGGKPDPGTCRWKPIILRWCKLFVYLGTVGHIGGMDGNTLVLKLRPKVANHFLEAESKLIYRNICSDLPHTSVLKTTIGTNSSCYDNIQFTSVLDSFYMELRGRNGKFSWWICRPEYWKILQFY